MFSRTYFIIFTLIFIAFGYLFYLNPEEVSFSLYQDHSLAISPALIAFSTPNRIARSRRAHSGVYSGSRFCAMHRARVRHICSCTSSAGSSSVRVEVLGLDKPAGFGV